jgi:hypothetical protein
MPAKREQAVTRWNPAAKACPVLGTHLPLPPQDLPPFCF